MRVVCSFTNRSERARWIADIAVIGSLDADVAVIGSLGAGIAGEMDVGIGMIPLRSLGQHGPRSPIELCLELAQGVVDVMAEFSRKLSGKSPRPVGRESATAASVRHEKTGQ